ncbi:MAG: exodeoxyribonuclease VII large subunit [Candidatus Auribacterota bacterium]
MSDIIDIISNEQEKEISEQDTQTSRDRIYTVSELTTAIKATLESQFPPLWVEGEISNVRKPSSGHLYFTIKDARTQVQGIMYRSQASRIRFDLQDGMKILLFGKITVYERSGQYQIMAQIIEPRGVGALQLAFEQLKKKLAEEGLFDPAHKKKIPILPDRIGVVTSATGAAIRDILNVLNRRFSNIQLIINPVRVQGDEAPPEIARAIEDFNQLNLVDVILVTRGGGSIEDLWAFNTEIVARSIYNSKIPVISAVGHEIDWTISDFVADLRVPTPSAAAELVVASKTELHNRINHLHNLLDMRMRNYIDRLRYKMQYLTESNVFAEPVNRIKQHSQFVDELEFRLTTAMRQSADSFKHRLVLLTEKLHAFSPSSSLLRGYSVTSVIGKEGALKSISDVSLNDTIKTLLHDGEIISKVERVDSQSFIKKNYSSDE